MVALFRKLKETLSKKGDFQKVIVSSVFSMGIKLLAVAAGFFMNFIFSRHLGVTEVGKFFVVFSVINILAMIGKLGFDRTVLRFVATYSAQNEWGKVKGVQFFSFKIVAIFTTIFATILFFLAEPIAVHVLNNKDLAYSFKLFAFAIIPLALIQNTCESIKGIRKVQLGIFLYNTLLPALTAVIFIAFASRSSVYAIFSYLIACGFVFILTISSWKWFMSRSKEKRAPVESKELLNSAMPMFITSIFTQITIWMPSFMLGMWSSPKEVGLFEMAKRTAMLITFFLGAFNGNLAPRIAALYVKGELKKIESLCVNATFLIGGFALPVYLGFLFFSNFFMHLFGKSFGDASNMLRIVATGQFFNAISGPVGLVLMMCGREKKMRNIYAITAIILLGLNYLLIPTLGGLGASITTCIILFLQNIMAGYYVWREFGIIAFPFIGKFVKSRKLAKPHIN